MPILTTLTSVFPVIAAGIKGFFGVKQNQLETVAKVLQIMQQVDVNDTELRKAALAAVVADAQSESWLARSWRPLTMLTFLALIIANYFGYNPSGYSPAGLERMYTLLEYGILGYGGARSFEKIAGMVINTKLLGNLLNK